MGYIYLESGKVFSKNYLRDQAFYQWDSVPVNYRKLVDCLTPVINSHCPPFRYSLQDHKYQFHTGRTLPSCELYVHIALYTKFFTTTPPLFLYIFIQ